MIVIERLQAHNFKQLRDVDLSFPRTCRVLIEGLNEAGKSTLFEAIHFVLYGRGLVTLGRGRGSTDSIISYGEQNAHVAADLRLDGTLVRVERTLSRNRAAQAMCLIEHPDGTREEVRQTQRVNEELLANLNGLDSDSLLASCFVEQKKLAKLEELTRERRQEVLLKLLDLDRLTHVKRRFAWERRDDQSLLMAERRLRLAEAAQRLDLLRSECAKVERRLTLAWVRFHLIEADGCAAQAAGLLSDLDVLSQHIQSSAAQIATTEALDRAIVLLDRALASESAVSSAKRQVAELQHDLDSLSRLERVTIPALQTERGLLEQLAEWLGHVAALDEHVASLRGRAERLAGIIAAGEGIERLAAELARTRLVAEQEAIACGAAQERALAAERAVKLRRQAAQSESERADRIDRSCRIRESAAVWSEAQGRYAANSKRVHEITAAQENAIRVSKLAEAARRLDACQSQAREYDLQDQGLLVSEQRLVDLEVSYRSIEQLDERAVVAEGAAESARRELVEAQDRLRVSRLARALIEWAQASRDSEARKAGQAGVDRLDRGVDEARQHHQRAADQARATTLLVFGAVALSALGLAAVVVIHVAILIAVVGAVLAAGAWIRRSSMQRSVEIASEVLREQEAAARDARVRIEVLLGKSPPDISAIEAQLLQYGGTVPMSPDAADSQAASLQRSAASAADLLEQERQARDTYEEANKTALESRARVGAERDQLAGRLHSDGLGTFDSVAIRQEEVAAALLDLQDKRRKLDDEMSEMIRIVPPGVSTEELMRDAEEARLEAQRLQQEIEHARQRAEEEQQRAAAALRKEGVDNPAYSEAAAGSLDHAAAELAESIRLLRSEASVLELTLPETWSVEALRDAHSQAQSSLREAELAAQASDTRLSDATSALNADLHAVEIATWTEARDALQEAEAEATLLGSKRDRVMRQTLDAGAHYALPSDVEQTRRRVLQELARVSQQLKGADERLQSRNAIDQRRLEAENAAEQHRLESESSRSAAFAILVTLLTPPSTGSATKEVLRSVRDQRASIDLEGLRRRHAEQSEQLGQTEATRRRALEDEAEARRAAGTLVRSLGTIVPSHVALTTLRPLLPDLDSVSADDRVELERQRLDVLGTIRHEDETAAEIEKALHVRRDDLDHRICRDEYARLGRRRLVCEGVATVLDRVRENVLQAVLPNTMAYMCLLLPLLTAGRYHDAQLDDGSYRIEVWDNQAQGFVVKDVFSGATQDQFSLALRLGFALAALPQERGARPGFLFMDEPVAGFDHQRRDALLGLLTMGQLADYFPQVFLAVPAGVFERNPLQYLIRLDHGRVVQNTLPSIQEAS